ncbi:MAG: WD40 repeat domain-containing protein [Spirochaetaceae bacterium]|nr:WD40 repeat domain-containing protein [Spirochaetaceae bacterium]
MANKKKIYGIILAFITFIAYILLAAQPIPQETVLTVKWIKSLKGDYNETGPVTGQLIPFTLGNRFGYADMAGNPILNKEREEIVSLSAGYWAEYPPTPRELVIHNSRPAATITINNPQGYPLFLDDRIFLIGMDQCSLEELDDEGRVLWRYSFEAPLTCIDAAGTYVLTGTLDGMIDLLDNNGKPLFPSYAPGASRIPVILGCRISSDGSKLAVVSGIDKQRFLFLEWYGNNDYRVTFHEFLRGEGFRREVQMAFIENDTRVIFEQETGLGVYDVRSRTSITLPLSGRLEVLDEKGGDGLFFYITSGKNGEKRLTAFKPPSLELINIPFKTESVFLCRQGKELILGGGMTLASFALDKL